MKFMKFYQKKAISNSFDKVAKSYNHYSKLQKLCGKKLFSLLRKNFNKDLILDAGCGPGFFSQFWKKKGSQVIALDISEKMLYEAKKKNTAHYYILGDIDFLPLLDNVVDLCWCNLSIQWCENFKNALNQLCRVTKKGGKVLFSTLAKNSLIEIRNAWYNMDKKIKINDFLSFQEIKSLIEVNNFYLTQTTFNFFFPDIISAMYSLKKTGAIYLHDRKDHGLVTSKYLQKLQTFWKRKNKKYLLSYQIVFGILYL